MPIYEPKLISPLAIRFTQEHIRTTFQDGRVVEDSIDEAQDAPIANECNIHIVVPSIPTKTNTDGHHEPAHDI